jgi:beta-1,4-N-acetylglucosaminyltransferase
MKSFHVVRSPALWGDKPTQRVRLGVANLFRALRILSAERPDLIVAISTAQALPFAMAGQILGIPLWYVESFTRVRTPSRTGRWLSRVGLCARQFYHWPQLSRAYPRGECTKSVNGYWTDGQDSFQPTTVGTNAGSQMIFVTVGTHHFDDLVRTVDKAAATKCFDLPAMAQIAHGTYEPRHMEFFRTKPDLCACYDRAHLTVAHGGTGTTLELLARGSRFISVANSMMQDNHQGELLEALAQEGLIRYCRDLSQLPRMIEIALREPPPPPVAIRSNFAYVGRALDEWAGSA